MNRSTPFILTIDVGTSACKCAIMHIGGAMQGWSKAPYSEHYPQPGWVEQCPEDWWTAAGRCVREAIQIAEIEPGQVTAIGVTGQMHGVVAVDARGEALTPCLTLRDARATREARQIVNQLGLDQIYQITGGRLAPSLPAAKVRWIRNNWPDLFRRTRAFLAPKDYLRLQLTGAVATEVIDAAGMLLYDVRRGAWSETMAAAAQVPLGKLPTIRDPWDLAGALSADAARHLSLRCGTPVYVGGGDDIEFLGYGIVEPGAALEHIGTTGSIMACIDRPVADPAMAVELYPHVEPSMWLVGGSVNAAGGALDWASQVLDLPVGADLRVCSPPALDRPLIFLPYLAGERCPIWEPAAKGCWFGLTLVHQRADLLRAAHEGVCFALRHVLQTIEDLPPVPDESRTENPAVSIPYLVTPKSDADAGWLAMRATIYGRPLRVVDTPDPTALGTAIVAGLGAGLYASLAAGVAATRGNDEWLEPDMSQAPRYNQLFALYRELTTTVHPLFSRFSGGLSDNEDPDH